MQRPLVDPLGLDRCHLPLGSDPVEGPDLPILAPHAHPEDAAFAALYLCSDEAAWITGTLLVVDGGISLR